MANFCLIVQYDGTQYNGWQRQGNTPDTIQEKLELILEHLYGQPVEVNGSGRTDAGVHALHQVANYRVPRLLSKYSCQEIQSYFNQYLPMDIRVLSVQKADDRFHARLNASGKLYEYKIDCGDVANVFQRRYLYRVEEPLNIPNMEKAASYLVGTHDFKSFQASGGQEKETTVRTIHSLIIRRDAENVIIEVSGDGFLYNMVRIIVGTLTEVGLGKKNPDELKNIIESRDRQKAGHTAPAEGLYLVEVYY